MPITDDPFERDEQKDEEEIKMLKEKFTKLDTMTAKAVEMLRLFDDRLEKLETSILPIHTATQQLAGIQSEVQRNINNTKIVLDYFDLATAEEEYILKGPQDDLIEYFKALERVRESIAFLQRSKLKSAARVLNQAKQILKVGIQHLRDMYRTWLSENQYEVTEEQMRVARYLASVETDDPASGSLKIFHETRAQELLKSLVNYAHAARSNADPSNPNQSPKDFARFMKHLLVNVNAEQQLLAKLIKSKRAPEVWVKVVQPTLDLFINTGEAIIASCKRNLTHAVFLLAAVYEITVANEQTLLGFFENLPKVGKYTEMVNSMKATVVSFFPEFYLELQTTASKNLILSDEGTVHELTVNTINQVRKFLQFPAMMERSLKMLGDGKWKFQTKTQEHLKMDSILEHFISDILNSLVQVLDNQARNYKKPGLSTIFLLNNYCFIAACCKEEKFQEVMGEGYMTKYDQIMKKLKDVYLDSWRPVVQNVNDAALRAAMADKSIFKDRMKKFNEEFEEMHRTQSAYAIPDPDLRKEVATKIKQMVVPPYGSFMDRYRNADMKNSGKYVKYMTRELEKMLDMMLAP